MAVFPFLTNTPIHKRMGSYGSVKFLNELLDAIIYAGVVVFMLIRPFAVQTFLIPSESMVNTLLKNDFIIANKALFRMGNPKHGDIIVFKPPSYALDPGQGDVDYIKRLIGLPGDLIELKNGVVYRNGKVLKEPYVSEQMMPQNWKLVHYTGPYAKWNGRYVPVTYRDGGDYNSGGFANYQVSSVSKEWAIGYDPNAIYSDRFSYPTGWNSELTPEEEQRMKYLLDAPPAKIPPGYYLMMGDNRNNSYDGRYWGLIPRESLVGKSEIIWWPPGRWQRTRSIATD